MRREVASNNSNIYLAKQPFRYALETRMGQLFGIGMDEGTWQLVIDPVW